jgi:protein-S-isoprenylcysteine O-methyltransferase Ste14
MIAVLIALIAGHSLLADDPIPIGLQILAFSLMIWARMTFGGRSFHAAANPTAGGVVTSGPYGFVRHPIYAAALLFTWTGILSHFSMMNLVLGMCVVTGVGLRIAAEEKLLVERYPEYKEYAKRTKRIIPFLI